MNPFMEQTWADVHLALIGSIRQVLGGTLPDDLSAKGEMRVNVLGGSIPYFKPDVAVLEDSWRQGVAPSWSPELGRNGIIASDPIVYEVEEVTHRWIEIRSDEGVLITVIEILSPVNKLAGQAAYMAKRNDLLAAGVSIVEIDLLRQGRRTVNVSDVPDFEKTFPKNSEHYITCVTRGCTPARREVYATHLREPLPTIRIPLRVIDQDVPLALQELIDQCYITGRYWKARYNPAQLEPGLSQENKKWVMERLQLAGLKTDEVG